MSYEKKTIIPIYEGTVTIEGTAWNGKPLYFRSRVRLENTDDVHLVETQYDTGLFADGKPFDLIPGPPEHRLVLDIQMIPVESGSSRMYDLDEGAS